VEKRPRHYAAEILALATDVEEDEALRGVPAEMLPTVRAHLAHARMTAPVFARLIEGKARAIAQLPGPGQREAAIEAVRANLRRAVAQRVAELTAARGGAGFIHTRGKGDACESTGS
jgi:hypothetical protein